MLVSRSIKPWYEKSITTIAEGYFDFVPPHTWTERINYLVPIPKTARIADLRWAVSRAAASGAITVEVSLTPSGGGLVLIYRESAISNVQYVHLIGGVIRDIWLKQGDRIIVRTEDLSVTGSLSISMGLIGSEFTA